MVTADTIADEQILAAYEAGIIDYDTACPAIYTSPGWGRREAARARCAEILNARKVVQP